MRRLGGVILVLAALAGCSVNETSYEVIDRFRYANYDEVPKDKRPPGRYFLVVKDASQPKGEAKHFIDQELWESCWMGDRFLIKKIGKDRCIRTEKSEMPTVLKRKGNTS